MLYGIKTTIGQESLVAEMLEGKIKREHENIAAVAVIPGLKGYVIIETDDENELRKLLYKAPHIKKILEGELKFEEIEHFFETKSVTKGIERGNIVEITSGAFKGEKAKVIRIDSAKDKITVEIIGAAVPIPVTVDAGFIRVLQRGENE